MSKKVTRKTTTFCEICHHGVWNMENHLATKEHERNVRNAGIDVRTRPHLPSQVNRRRTGRKW